MRYSSCHLICVHKAGLDPLLQFFAEIRLNFICVIVLAAS